MIKKPRKKKNAPGQGRKAEGHLRCTIHMTPEAWARLDELRGREPRGKWIARTLLGR